MSTEVRVVALGGGHGTAVTLQAMRRYSGAVTGIVSTADDGGSSGRLRDLLGLPALGDIRKCLVALAGADSSLAAAMEVRYTEGELAGHVLGNLLLAGLIAETGDLVRGIDEVGRLLGAAGRVLPATSEPTELRALRREGILVGQVAIGRDPTVTSVSVLPESAAPPAAALEAIHAADQVVIGPGSLYTSVLAAAAVPAIAEALRTTTARRVYVCNLRPQAPETAGYSVADHVDALVRHQIPVDIVLCDTSTGIEMGSPQMATIDVDLAGSNGLVHEPGKLAMVLSGLVA